MRGGRGGRGGMQNSGMQQLGKGLKLRDRERKGVTKKWGQARVSQKNSRKKSYNQQIYFVSLAANQNS